jgi:hypothetical protein
MFMNHMKNIIKILGTVNVHLNVRPIVIHSNGKLNKRNNL